MRYLLDTSVVILLRDRNPLAADFIAATPPPFAMPIIVRLELENGVYRDPNLVAVRRLALDAILPRFRLIDFGSAEFLAYAQIVEALGFNRRTILDRMIAATAIVHDLELVTLNPADFAPIPGLRIAPAP